MHEGLFAASGLRLPLVMAVANRALSAPINIWNDIQDTVDARDSGWIQLYCETNQECFDTIVQAYRVAEDKKVLLPAMVCLDGYYLTHMVEPVEIPDIGDFAGEYEPEHAYLDPERPMTQGPFAYPDYYMDLRKQQEDAIQNSKEVLKKVDEEFEKRFGRKYGLLEKIENGPDCILTVGSLTGTARVASEKAGTSLIKLKCFRPFPKDEMLDAVKNIERLIVIEKDVSIGLGSGAIYSELLDVFYESPGKPEVYDFICGLGGRDVTIGDIERMVKKVREGKAKSVEWWL